MTSEAVGYGMAPCATCEACARRDAEIEYWMGAAKAADREIERLHRAATDWYIRWGVLRGKLAAIRAAWRPEEYAGFRAVSGEQGVVYAITAEQRAAIDAALEVEP